MCLHYNSLENTVGIGEIARNEQFLLFPQRFLPIWKSFCHFHETKNCHLQTLSVWKNLKCVVWERFKDVIVWQRVNFFFTVFKRNNCVIREHVGTNAWKCKAGIKKLYYQVQVCLFTISLKL